jgi:hypothetical protein
MPGNAPQVSPLASRKQLLLAESELNRALLGAEMAALTSDLQAFTNRAKSFGSIVASSAALVAGLTAFRRARPAPDAKPSWLRTLSRGARLLFTIWLELGAVKK